MQKQVALSQEFLAIFAFAENVELSLVVNQDKSTVLELFKGDHFRLSDGKDGLDTVLLCVKLLYFDFEILVLKILSLIASGSKDNGILVLYHGEWNHKSLKHVFQGHLFFGQEFFILLRLVTII